MADWIIRLCLIAIAIPFRAFGEDPAVIIAADHARCEMPLPAGTPYARNNPLEIADYAKLDRLSIIDAHMHLNAGMDPSVLIRHMSYSGVKRMVLMARYYPGIQGGGGNDEQALAFAANFPNHFLPLIAGQRQELSFWKTWKLRDGEYLKETKNKALSGRFNGMGEYIMRHYAYTLGKESGGHMDVDVPVHSPLMTELARIAASRRLPVFIHFEGEPARLQEMIDFLNSARDTKIVWAHSCGRMSAEQIRWFLSQFPNLYCDLAGMTRTQLEGEYGDYWPKRTPWIHPIEDGHGRLCPEMLSIYEQFPTRFLIGTDVAHTQELPTYDRRIIRFRQYLSQLAPTTARRIAYQNAEELFGLTGARSW